MKSDFDTEVAGEKYRVIFAETLIVDASGASCASILSHQNREITISGMTRAIDIPATIAAVVSQAWRERLDWYAANLREKWDGFSAAADAMQDEWVEQPTEDDGPQFIAGFDELVRLGVKFDPLFAAGLKSIDGSPGSDFSRETEATFSFADGLADRITTADRIKADPTCDRWASIRDSFVDGGMSVDDGQEQESRFTAPRRFMTLTVGARTYRASIATNLIHKKRKVLGLVSEANGTIHISNDCHRDQRLAVLMHELTHAWIYAVGEPNGDEGLCSLVATMAEMAFREITQQGGIAALMEMQTTVKSPSGGMPAPVSSRPPAVPKDAQDRAVWVWLAGNRFRAPALRGKRYADIQEVAAEYNLPAHKVYFAVLDGTAIGLAGDIAEWHVDQHSTSARSLLEQAEEYLSLITHPEYHRCQNEAMDGGFIDWTTQIKAARAQVRGAKRKLKAEKQILEKGKGK